MIVPGVGSPSPLVPVWGSYMEVSCGSGQGRLDVTTGKSPIMQSQLLAMCVRGSDWKACSEEPSFHGACQPVWLLWGQEAQGRTGERTQLVKSLEGQGALTSQRKPSSLPPGCMMTFNWGGAVTNTLGPNR